MVSFGNTGNNVYYTARLDKNWYVVCNGQQGRLPFTGIALYSLRFSPDDAHFAYVGKLSNGECLVVDGKLSVPAEGIRVNNMVLTNTGHYAVVQIIGKEQRLVVNGVAGAPYGYIDPDKVVFNAQGTQFAYTVQEKIGGNYRVVVGKGEPSIAYGRITRFIFSPNGKRLAYDAYHQDGARVVLDGKEIGDTYSSVSHLTFTPDSRHLVYYAENHAGKLITLPPPPLEPGKIPLSFDSPRVNARNMYEQQEQWVVVDGVPQPTYRYVKAESITISPDGAHLAYEASPDGKSNALIVDGQVVDTYQIIGKPIFSPNGKRLAYSAMLNGQWVMMLDGQASTPCDGFPADMAAFSPDSSRFAYVMTTRRPMLDTGDPARNQMERTTSYNVVVDSVIGPTLSAILDGPCFSQDSAHVAYTGADNTRTEDNRVLVMVDGVKSWYPMLIPARDNHYLYRNGRDGFHFFTGLTPRDATAVLVRMQ